MGTTRASRCRRRAAHGCALFQAQARCGAAAAPRGALVGARRGAGGRAQVTDALARGTDVILRLDVQGAATVRRLLPGAVSVFLARACPRSARRACVCCMRRGPCCSCHRPGRCVAWRGAPARTPVVRAGAAANEAPCELGRRGSAAGTTGGGLLRAQGGGRDGRGRRGRWRRQRHSWRGAWWTARRSPWCGPSRAIAGGRAPAAALGCSLSLRARIGGH